MSFRESAVVIIETSRAHIRAGLGLHELLKTPSIVRLRDPPSTLSVL